MYTSQMDFLSSLRDAAPGMSLSDALPIADQTGLPKGERAVTNEDNIFYAYLLASRKKIVAIKEYRRATGCGLKDAKDYIDGMEADIRRRVTAYNIANPTYPAIV